MILAWLLDKDITAFGTHAQGNLGFRIFLEELGLPGNYADGDYRVWRESCSDESRIDVEVAQRGRFVVHIENKIWSGEGRDQTNREWSDLRRRAESLDCPEYHGLYLTPKGNKPTNPGFRPISWRQIADVVDRFANEAKPPEVRVFARHYARVLRKHIVPELPSKESDDACADV